MSDLENDVQAEILIAVTAIPCSMFWRQNTGAVKIEERFIRFGLKGAPDILGMIRGRFIGIEAKRLNRGRQSVDQRRWQRNCEAAGGVYILANSVDKVWQALRENGLVN